MEYPSCIARTLQRCCNIAKTFRATWEGGRGDKRVALRRKIAENSRIRGSLSAREAQNPDPEGHETRQRSRRMLRARRARVNRVTRRVARCQRRARGSAKDGDEEERGGERGSEGGGTEGAPNRGKSRAGPLFLRVTYLTQGVSRAVRSCSQRLRWPTKTRGASSHPRPTTLRRETDDVASRDRSVRRHSTAHRRRAAVPGCIVACGPFLFFLPLFWFSLSRSPPLSASLSLSLSVFLPLEGDDQGGGGPQFCDTRETHMTQLLRLQAYTP